MMNIINGGAHADNPIDFQEFMIVPVGAPSLTRGGALGRGSVPRPESALKKAGHNTNVGDEGGFAPNLPSAEAALDFCLEGDRKRRLQAGPRHRARARRRRDGILQGRRLCLCRRGRDALAAGAGAISRQACRRLSDRHHRGRQCPRTTGKAGRATTDLLGDKIQLVGDDIFVTNVERLAEGIKKGVANSILVKVNQIGTLSETLAAVDMAQRAGYTAVMSHRSGETEDSTIADLAVATNCGQIKTGSLARSDRLAKYNQLIRIEEELGSQARYAGRKALKAWA